MERLTVAKEQANSLETTRVSLGATDSCVGLPEELNSASSTTSRSVSPLRTHSVRDVCVRETPSLAIK